MGTIMVNHKKKISYRKVYGCPKHGTTNGKIMALKSRDTNVEERMPCYKCEKCKKVYLEPDDKSSMGDTGKRVNGYSIWNTIGPFPVPEQVFVYDKRMGERLCDCPGSIKEKTKIITHFLLKNGKIQPLSGAKVCLLCSKVFMTLATYNNQREMLKKFDIQVIQLGTTIQKKISQEKASQKGIEISENKEHENIKKFQCINENWEDEFFYNDENCQNQEELEKLLPAERVASAYYDAKILYNPYQYLPWLKMYINGSRNLLISDEVGLGKTIEAGILIMEELTEDVNAKIIILCPAFLREKWYQELSEKFLLESQIYDGKTVIDSMTNIVILPISRIKQYLEKESIYNFSMIIIDEVHYFRNSNSSRYQFLSKLLEQIDDSKRIFMSATPINNSGSDYQSIERLFSSKADKTNTTKKEAYIYLPERHIEDVYVDLTEEEQKIYDTTDFLNPFSGTVYRHIGASCLYALSIYAHSGSELASETKEELRNSLEALLDGRNIEEIDEECFCGMETLTLPKVDSKVKKLKEILRRYKAESKIVLFSHYIETVKYLYSELVEEFNVGYIYANTLSNNIPCENMKNKFASVKKWFCKYSGKITILICSDTCREGIDLDIANVLINYDLPFNPSILEQRIGRIDRMSQKKDMYIYNFHVNDTYDDRLHFILATKLRFINYYADYGIGNPLNITSEEDLTFDSFIRYFSSEKKDFAVMSNEDCYVARRILRQIGVKIEKNKMDEGVLLNLLRNNQRAIESWFGEGEIKKITEDQLIRRRADLEKLLNFPKKIKRNIKIDDATLYRIVDKANKNPEFRKRISNLIKNYADKLKDMEISGMPMNIHIDDLRREYNFGTGEDDNFIQNSVIEVLRREGAQVYEIG